MENQMYKFKEYLQESEKLEHFLKRTNEHVKRVQGNAQFIVDHFPEYKDLLKQVKTHDQSKYEDPEREPYIEMSWNYKTGETEKNREPRIREASEHHVKNNRHHAEYWDDDPSPTINPDDRDVPLRLIDATKMDDISTSEMVCDWTAMSQEYNEGSCRGWADKNIDVRWKFTDTQKELIYKLIDTFENENI